MKKRNRAVSMLLCIVMVLGMLPVQAFAADIVANSYALCANEEASLVSELDKQEKNQQLYQSVYSQKSLPFEVLPLVNPITPQTEVPDGYSPIFSVEDLDSIRDMPTANYILMNDLDLSGYEWEPIGNLNIPFSGVFDGNGHRISDLLIKKEYGGDNAGLFGYVTGTIMNLCLFDGEIKTSSSWESVGSIAGYCRTIVNCSSNCAIDAECLYGGGIVGQAWEISQCFYSGDAHFLCTKTGTMGGAIGGICGSASTSAAYCINMGKIDGTVSGATHEVSYLGGIVGILYAKKIQNCFNGGELNLADVNTSTADAVVGGIVGGTHGGWSKFEDCYNLGDLTVQPGYVGEIGGIVGGGPFTNDYFVTRCYNHGAVTNNSKYPFSKYYTGGIAGVVCSTGSLYVAYCYIDEGTSSLAGRGGNQSTNIVWNGPTAQLSSADFTEQTSFESFDFEETWELQEGMSSPQLIAFHHILTADNNVDEDVSSFDHFGKMDSYDANGSAVIDGGEYQFTEEFKDSFDNIAYLYGGIYLDNYVYAMYNLDEENQITALRWTIGTLCTLEGWDATNSVVDTSLTPILPIEGAELKAGDYRVSEITKASFPTDQIADWVGDDIRVYTNGQEIFKVIHVEHKTGVVTAFDPNSLPLTVYIDDVGYPVLENEGLVAAIRDPFDNHSEYTKDAEFTLYDGLLVRLTYINEKLDPANFNEYIYRANTALDPENEQYSRWQGYLHGEVGDGTPSQATVDACKDTGFAALATAWTTTTTIFDSLVSSPTVAVKQLTITQEDMYTAIILESLECSYDAAICSRIESGTMDVRDKMGLLCDFINSLQEYDTVTETNLNDIYGDLSMETKGAIADFVAADFRETYGSIEKTGDFIEYLEVGFDAATTFEAWLENAVGYWNVLQLNGEMRQVIQQMYQTCPSANTAMKAALKKCDDVIRAGEDAFWQLMIGQGCVAAGTFIAIQVGDLMWECVSNAVEAIFPEVIIIKCIYKAGKLLANELFNADAQAEAYYKMLAVLNFESLGQTVMDKYAFDFDGGQTEELAKLYLESVKLNFQIQDTDADYAIKFYQEMKKQPSHILAEWIADADLDEIIQGFEEYKSLMGLSQMRFDTWWILWLSEDYPELFEQYQDRLLEEVKLEKQIKIACPVNVFVYDKNNELVAYVKDEKPFARGKISIIVDGDDKNIYFYDNEVYHIECEGYDSGAMDVLICEYEDSSISRTINYLDLQVNGTSIHNLDIGENDVKLISAENTFEPTYDSQADSGAYTVTIHNGFSTTNGTFASSFTAHKGEMIDISVYVPDDCSFDGWYSDKSLLSFEDPDAVSTRFVMINEDVTINALLSSPESSVHSVVFDENNGEASTTTVATNVDGTLDSLPSVTREGYAFDGWYTHPAGGELVTTDTVFTADTTVYAHWDRIVASGICGEDITWVLTEKGRLCLLGSGEMYAYDGDTNRAPWYEYRDEISSLRVDGGITAIVAYAFENCTALADVHLSDSVTEIGMFAFAGCTALTELALPANVTDINWRCFLGCDNLRSFSLSPDNPIFEIRDNVIFRKSDHALCFYAPGKTDAIYYVPEDVPSVTGWAFAGCKNLHAIVFPENFKALYVYAFENAANLSRVYFTGGVPEIWRANVFAGTSEELMIYYSEETAGWTDGTWENPETQEMFRTAMWRPERGLALASGFICDGFLQFDLLNLDSQTKEGAVTVLAVLYDNGKFVSVQTVDAQIGENRIPLPGQSEYTDCKLFAVDSKTYCPLCAALTIQPEIL